MEYPIWHLTTLGGGFWIAVIATLHVYVAHFAVGGGLFLVLTERAAYKSNNVHLLEYAKKHTRFFLLLTMAFGGRVRRGHLVHHRPARAPGDHHPHPPVRVRVGGGVGLLPGRDRGPDHLLLHLGDRMDRRDHMIAGWLYFLFGWLSLFLINGIIGFMLTPGDWINTKRLLGRVLQPHLLALSSCSGLVLLARSAPGCSGSSRQRASRERSRPGFRTVRTCSAVDHPGRAGHRVPVGLVVRGRPAGRPVPAHEMIGSQSQPRRLLHAVVLDILRT